MTDTAVGVSSDGRFHVQGHAGVTTYFPSALLSREIPVLLGWIELEPNEIGDTSSFGEWTLALLLVGQCTIYLYYANMTHL